jgi:hypothetical protein
VVYLLLDSQHGGIDSLESIPRLLERLQIRAQSFQPIKGEDGRLGYFFPGPILPTINPHVVFQGLYLGELFQGPTGFECDPIDRARVEDRYGRCLYSTCVIPGPTW